jgi:N-acetylglucosamine-6-sulfatase
MWRWGLHRVSVVLRGIPLAPILVAAVLVCASCGGQDEQGRRGKQIETTFSPEATLSAKEMPNILFVLTDDQDPESLARMDRVQRLLVRKGTSFENAFATTPLCCPSRVSFLRGQYAHNHGVLVNDNSPQLRGGYEGFRELGLQDSTVATWLDDVGYDTFYAGKLLNGYKNTSYVPPGWDEWYAFSGHPHWGSYDVNENGELKTYAQADNHETYYLRDKAEAFIREGVKEGGEPWFAMVATHAPHNPHTRAPEFRHSYDEASMPKPPSYNEADVSDKPEWIRARPRLDPRCETAKGNPDCNEEMTKTWRARQKALMSVDVMVKDLVDTLEETDQMERTYVVFASDNGFVIYRHRVYSKGAPYEEIQGIPFVVRGPGVRQGAVSHELVANIDLAPTIAEWADIQPPEYVDGRSLVPLLEGTSTSWRRWLLFEHFLSDHPYVGIRTAGGESYIEYESGEKEYYDLRVDPWQLHSSHAAPENAQRLAQLSRSLSVLKVCEGARCRTVDRGP